MLLTSIFAWALLVLGAYPNKLAGQLVGSWWMGAWYQFAPSFTDMVWQSLYGAFAGAEPTYNSNLWTMQPEFIGSVYVFITCALSRNRCVRTAILLLWAGVNITNYFPLFAAGALLYEYESDIRSLFNRVQPKLLQTVFILSLLCIAAYLGGIQDPQPGSVHCYSAMHYYGWLPQFPSENAMHWHQFGALALLLALLLSPVLQSLFGGVVGRYLGRISFVMYLFQVPVISSFTAGVVILTAGHSRFLVAAIASASTIAVIFLLSSATYWLIDSNAVVLSRFAGRKLDAVFPPNGSARASARD
jgi:peptidoglycan/LPS O-acetylase OafA/YrhL